MGWEASTWEIQIVKRYKRNVYSAKATWRGDSDDSALIEHWVTFEYQPTKI